MFIIILYFCLLIFHYIFITLLGLGHRYLQPTMLAWPIIYNLIAWPKKFRGYYLFDLVSSKTSVQSVLSNIQWASKLGPHLYINTHLYIIVIAQVDYTIPGQTLWGGRRSSLWQLQFRFGRNQSFFFLIFKVPYLDNSTKKWKSSSVVLTRCWVHSELRYLKLTLLFYRINFPQVLTENRPWNHVLFPHFFQVLDINFNQFRMSGFGPGRSEIGA